MNAPTNKSIEQIHTMTIKTTFALEVETNEIACSCTTLFLDIEGDFD